MRRAFALPTLLSGVLALAASPAAATLFNLSASLDGAQETPPVDTDGIGTLTGTYDDATNALAWSGSFSMLTGTTTDAHFHGPAAVGVGPAGIKVPMTLGGGGDDFPLNVTAGSYAGTATVLEADEADLLAGLWYVNIHSEFALGGEIRGQVSAVAVPEPGTLALLGAAIGAFALRRRASR